MKMKKWISGLLIILAFFLALIILPPTLLKVKGYDYAVGRYIPCDNGQHMIVYNNRYNDKQYSDYMRYERDNFFHQLTVGDKILVINRYGAIRNSIAHDSMYIFHGIKLADGDINDIPSKLVRYVAEQE